VGDRDSHNEYSRRGPQSEWSLPICQAQNSDDKQTARAKLGMRIPKEGHSFYALLSEQETVLWEIGFPRRWHEPCLFKVGAANQRTDRLKTTIINL
jgi:hypothetical protein